MSKTRRFIRVFSALLIGLLATSSAESQFKSDQYRNELLSGRAKSVHTEHYLVEANTNRLTSRDYDSFDAHGNKIRSINYDSTGLVSSISTSFYDRAGKRIRFRTFRSNETGLKKTYYRYDRLKRIAREITVTAAGALESLVIHDYRRRGRTVIQRHYNPKRRLTLTKITTFDSKQSKIAEEQRITKYFEGSDHGANKWKYSYDSNGNLSEWHFYRVDDGTERYLLKIVFKYDSSGNRSQELGYDDNGILTSKRHHHYEFDQKGNWVKKTSTFVRIEDGTEFPEQPRLEIRKISYY